MLCHTHSLKICVWLCHCASCLDVTQVVFPLWRLKKKCHIDPCSVCAYARTGEKVNAFNQHAPIFLTSSSCSHTHCSSPGHHFAIIAPFLPFASPDWPCSLLIYSSCTQWILSDKSDGRKNFKLFFIARECKEQMWWHWIWKIWNDETYYELCWGWWFKFKSSWLLSGVTENTGRGTLSSGNAGNPRERNWLSGWEGCYTRSPANQSETSQSGASVSSCMWKRSHSTLC